MERREVEPSGAGRGAGREELQAGEQCRRWKKQAQYFKWMLDEYADNAYVADMETYEILYLNRTSCKTVNLPLEKALGQKCYALIQGRTSPCPFCTNDRLTEDGFYEWDYYNPYLERAYLLKDRIVDWEGRRARLELSHDNLSLEYQLVQKERERDALIRTIPGGFARVDARDMRTALWYGGGFLDLIGYTKEQFESELHSQCNYVHPDDIERAAAIMERSRETGEDTVAEGRIITRDGTIKTLMMTYSYVSGADSWDGIDSFYSMGLDITKDRQEQQRQREVLEDAFQAAKVANAAKTNFLSTMSHNIRTPMNAIMGMITIARANPDSPEKIYDCLDKIDVSSRHLLNLINEVLDVSKIESGKIDLTLERLSLPALLKSIRDMCQSLVDEKGQRFEIVIGQVGHETVIADGDRLQQILMNLLSNAIKYTPPGGEITLSLNERYSEAPGKSQYEFVCTDNGIGIPRESLPYVFEPFWRAEDSRISTNQGTGLGMTITENIVRMMNGTIGVESELGAGSRFTVVVPLEVCQGQAVSADKGEGDASGSASLDGKRVLLAEDNELNREIAVELLQMQGVSTDAVENGRMALEAFDASAPGVYSAILMDIQMPVLNGYEATAAIRALGRADAQTIPIIALTADAFTADVAKARNTGMNDHIAKPIEMERLLEALHKWMG